MSGALLVAGTSSDAGKSVVVAGLCRVLRRKGVRVAPFKAQNMSNNSVVTVEGGEIGRAQAIQARAAGLEPSVRFNPILLKPGGDRTSQLVIRGRAADTVGAADYFAHRDRLAGIVEAELAGLRAEFDAVAAAPDDAAARDRLEDEIGDVLFVCANLARHAKVDVGGALRRANRKFERRFRAMEALAQADGGLAGKTLDAQDRYWNLAKAAEKEAGQ